MLDIEKYLTVLPEIVLVKGEFCVTEIGKKQPYDPFKKLAVSAKDQFYPIDKIVEAELDKYDTIGIKVANGISVIDIDGVVNKTTGEISDFAMEIIMFMKSYTELSPSGTGIRILFEADNAFDIDKYKTKNSEVDLEYYDADDQEHRGGRMARLSGDQIMPFEFRRVNTEEILEKYMGRVNYGRIAELEMDKVDADYVKLVYVLIALRTDLKNLFNREVKMNYESDTDLIVVNAIAEYTRNPAEINEVFKMTRYYKTKGVLSDKAKHKDKWNSDYGWNTIAMANPQEIKLNPTAGRFEIEVLDRETMIVVAEKHGFVKKFNYRKEDIDWEMSIENDLEIEYLHILAALRLGRKSVIKYIEELK